MPDAETEKPYEEITDPEFGRLAAQTFLLQDLGRVGGVLSGPCPRCGHPLEVPLISHVVKGTPSFPYLLRKARRESAEDRIEPMVCECSAKHDGRPPERTGCGAYWLLVIKDRPR